MGNSKTIDVTCKCGKDLARYTKVGEGRLQKMYLSHIVCDRAGIFLSDPPKPTGTEIFCTSCQKKVATILMVRGRPAAKMNKVAIKPVRT